MKFGLAGLTAILFGVANAQDGAAYTQDSGAFA
jgi:hypothetical protein